MCTLKWVAYFGVNREHFGEVLQKLLFVHGSQPRTALFQEKSGGVVNVYYLTFIWLTVLGNSSPKVWLRIHLPDLNDICSPTVKKLSFTKKNNFLFSFFYVLVLNSWFWKIFVMVWFSGLLAMICECYWDLCPALRISYPHSPHGKVFFFFSPFLFWKCSSLGNRDIDLKHFTVPCDWPQFTRSKIYDCCCRFLYCFSKK